MGAYSRLGAYSNKYGIQFFSVGWGWGGRLFEAGRLLTFSACRMGAYSRRALIRDWVLIRINTVCNFIIAISLSILLRGCDKVVFSTVGLADVAILLKDIVSRQENSAHVICRSDKTLNVKNLFCACRKSASRPVELIPV